MSIQFQCARCGKDFRVRDELAGKAAKCTCGARLRVPEVSLDAIEPRVSSPPDDPAGVLVDASVADKEQDASAAKIDRTILKATGQWSIWRLKPYLESTNSKWLKLLIGAIVGGLLGLRALAPDPGRAQPSLSFRVVMFSLSVVMGMLAVSILLIADSVRARKQAGQPVPFLLRMYFSSGWLSVGLWAVTAFAVAFAYIATLAL